MKLPISSIVLILLGAVWSNAHVAHATNSQNIVKAVFFYSPECPHCHDVITQHMPGISEQFGDQLLIVYVDVSSTQGAEYFNNVMDHFSVASDQRAVPAVVVGDRLLVGGVEIPNELPKIAAAGLEAGGIDWPRFAGLPELGRQAERLATAEAATESVRTVQATASAAVTTIADTPTAPPEVGAVGASAPSPSSTPVPGPGLVTRPERVRSATEVPLRERLAQHRGGFSLALAVLVSLVLSALFVGVRWLRFGLNTAPPKRGMSELMPVLALLGLAVATYLAYVEVTARPAACGPVGECNVVQQSPYAKLFGVLPVGVLGMLGYVTILALWAWQRLAPSKAARRFAFLLPSVLMFGVLFSIYLTYLEIVVIGAVCMWCLASALIMGALLWATYLGGANPPQRAEPTTSQ